MNEGLWILSTPVRSASRLRTATASTSRPAKMAHRTAALVVQRDPHYLLWPRTFPFLFYEHSFRYVARSCEDRPSGPTCALRNPTQCSCRSRRACAPWSMLRRLRAGEYLRHGH